MFRKGNKILEIIQDLDPADPREWDNLGKMVCFHKRYTLGNKHDLKSEQFEGWDDIEKYLIEHENAKTILPLYMMDHSGLHIQTIPFSGLYGYWDSGQIGFIYATEKDEQTEDILESEIEVYNQYIKGDVYGFNLYVVKKCNLDYEHRICIEGCFGFYGSDFAKNGLLECANIDDFEEWIEIER
jgi:hypothetical protein